MLVNKLSTSNETINLFEVRRLVILLTNEKVTNLRTSNKFMVSFDVESLFTNIPLLESISWGKMFTVTKKIFKIFQG